MADTRKTCFIELKFKMTSRYCISRFGRTWPLFFRNRTDRCSRCNLGGQYPTRCTSAPRSPHCVFRADQSIRPISWVVIVHVYPKVTEAPSLPSLSWLVIKLILQCSHNNLIFCDGLFHFSNPASVITVFSVTCMMNGNRLDWAMLPLEQLVFFMRHSGWVALAPSNSGSESSGQTLPGDEHQYFYCMVLKWTTCLIYSQNWLWVQNRST